ncbi:helix-turn-helix domain-containing protein [Streptomyces sp. NPDC006875]|uniref:helix-turn-helix domain-containing protein n=1 Tax=Streptomyces sp. NPDC006875 TaxID=3154781 RepID=UPI0033FD25D1
MRDEYQWTSATAVPSVTDWSHAFTALHGASEITVPDRTTPWTGQLDSQQSARYAIALCRGGQETVTRNARHISSDPRGNCELLIPLAGAAWVEQGSSSGEISAGAMAFCDMDRPLTFAHDDDFLSIALIVPAREVAHRSPVAVREPQMLRADSGLGRVIRTMVTTLQEERELLSEATFDLACERLLDLVCLAVEGASDTAPAGQRATVEVEIRRYIRRHASDEDLDTTVIARALGWSARYIQHVLQAAGTTSRELIRRERLELARARLASAHWAGHSVAHIAYSCGFGSHASFSTAFRLEFGMTPREARSNALPQSDLG